VLAGGKAIGLSGVDGGLLKAKVADPELGLVGEVTSVNTALLETVLKAGLIAVVAPVSLNAGGKAGQDMILNVNGDTATGEIAAALKAERLIFMTDVAGVRDKDGKSIARLSPTEGEALITSGVAAGGMEPKIRACVKALKAMKAARIIDGRQPHAILNEIDGKGQGTTVSV
jgi:acetylglutamate kinase